MKFCVYVYSFLFVFATLSTTTADVIPDWDLDSPLDVVVPAGGSTTLNATGSISVGTLDAILVFDRSTSMNEPTDDPAPNGGSRRSDWARDGAKLLLDNLAEDARFGLTQFSTSAAEVVPLDTLGFVSPPSPHRVALDSALNTMIGNLGGTNIANAIAFATNQLNEPSANSASKHIVLVTDGDDQLERTIRATNDALTAGVDSVHTVGLPGASDDLLAAVAATGQGRFVDGSDLSVLLEDFSTILDNVETLERLEIVLPSGVTQDVFVDDMDQFQLDLEIVEGVNTFDATAFSNLGNERTATLIVNGVVVPEPSGILLCLFGALIVFGTQRSRG